MSRMRTLVTPPHLFGRLPWAAWAGGLVWLLVAASAVHWGLRLGVRGQPLSPQVPTVEATQALQGDAGRLFARAEAAPAAAPSPARDRFRVLGVAAREGEGWALLSVDGRPPRVYRRGAAVDAQWQVLSIGQRRIDIGPAGGPAVVSIDLPGLPAAATGRLAPVSPDGSQGPAGSPAVMPAPQRPMPYPQEGTAPAPEPLPDATMAR